MNEALKKLIERMSHKAGGFERTQYSQPVVLAIHGKSPEISELKEEAKELAEIDLTDEEHPPGEKHTEKLLYLALSLAELIEASQADKQNYFISDTKFRSHVFKVKRSPGWALVLGDLDQTELITRLIEKKFIVFSTFAHPQVVFLGNRDTSSIYFLQNQVRYAMIYGRIEPGNPHEMSHFLEDDGPGIIIVNGSQSEVEALLTLGYMMMGCPAIVPSSFPHHFGNRVVVDDVDGIIKECMRFPNLRIIEHEGSAIQMPEYCDPANLKQKVIVEKSIGGTELSFLAVRRARVEDCIEVIGEPGQHLGVLIELDYEGMNEVASEFLELIAAAFPSYIKGVITYDSFIYDTASRPSATRVNGLRLGLAKGVVVTGKMIAETIHAGLKKRYPRLGKLKVTVIFDENVLRAKKPEIDLYKAKRAKIIASTTEENMKEFYSCVGCQPFAREHVCIVTPERPPMCSRDWRQMMVGAYLNPEDIPDPLSRRRTRFSSNAFSILRKGKVIDAKRGEWTGVNRGAYRESVGRIKRVQIHSVTGGYPHSSCGCFGCLVFYIPEVDGLGIMKRGFKGEAPNGMTWDLLANKAGGKQQPGICGVSLNYLKSPKFMQGDGGFNRVVWMDQDIYGQLKDVLSKRFKIATENDVKNIEDLKKFLEKRTNRNSIA